MKRSENYSDRLGAGRLIAVGLCAAAAGVSAFALPSHGGVVAAVFVGLALAAALYHPKVHSQQLTTEASLLEESVRVLMVDADPTSALTRMVKLAVKSLRAKAGLIFLRSDDKNTVFLTEAKYSGVEDFEFPSAIALNSEFSQRIVETGKPQVLTALQSTTILGDTRVACGELIGLPIHTFVRRGAHIESACIGIVTLLFEETGRIDKDLEETLTELAAVVGMAIAPGWHRRNIQQTLSRTLEMMVNLFEGRCEFTEGHSKRVSVISVELGRKLGLGYESLEDIRLGALLHDIGKIAIPENILNKPGKLTEEDFEVIRQHPVIGYQMCRPVQLPDCVLKIVRNHHENLDGTGYPDRLSGPDLTLYMRIVAVADSFDAMCSRRAYRDPMAMEKVIGELTRNAGTQFDPVVVEKLKESIADEWLIALYRSHAEPKEGRAA